MVELNETILVESPIQCQACGFTLYYLTRGLSRDPPFCRNCDRGKLDQALHQATVFKLLPRDDRGRVQAPPE